MSEKISEKAQTEARAQAPSSSGLSPIAEGILGRVKPTSVDVAYGLRQSIYFEVAGYKIRAEPSRLHISDYEGTFCWELYVNGRDVETADFYWLDEPEPSLYEVLDYWARLARHLDDLVKDMAEVLVVLYGDLLSGAGEAKTW